MKKLSILYTALAFTTILSIIGGVSSFLANKQNMELNAAMSQLFHDYCNDKGGVIALKDVEIYLPNLGKAEDYTLLSCMNDENYGILLYNLPKEKIKHYIPEAIQ